MRYVIIKCDGNHCSQSINESDIGDRNWTVKNNLNYCPICSKKIEKRIEEEKIQNEFRDKRGVRIDKKDKVRYLDERGNWLIIGNIKEIYYEGKEVLILWGLNNSQEIWIPIDSIEILSDQEIKYYFGEINND